MNYLWFALLSMYFINGSNQDKLFIYPELDREIILVRSNLKSDRIQQAMEHFVFLESIWQNIVLDIRHADIRRINTRDILDLQALRLDLIEKMINEDKVDRAIDYVGHFYTEMMHLRDCLDNEYPLDQLWKTLLIYEDFSSTIHDRMLQLEEWFEIEDKINLLRCTWEEYELLFQDLIPIYFPGFDMKRQNELYIQMNDCINNFLKSSESGFRPDFILPCDEIGNVLEETLRLYTTKIASNI